MIELPVVAGPDHPSVVIAEIYSSKSDVDEVGNEDATRTTTATTVVTTPRYTDSSSITLGWTAQRRTKIDVNTYEAHRQYENELRSRSSRLSRRRHGPRFQLRRLSRAVRKRILQRNGIETSDIESEDNDSRDNDDDSDSSNDDGYGDGDERSRENHHIDRLRRRTSEKAPNRGSVSNSNRRQNRLPIRRRNSLRTQYKTQPTDFMEDAKSKDKKHDYLTEMNEISKADRFSPNSGATMADPNRGQNCSARNHHAVDVPPTIPRRSECPPLQQDDDNAEKGVGIATDTDVHGATLPSPTNDSIGRRFRLTTARRRITRRTNKDGSSSNCTRTDINLGDPHDASKTEGQESKDGLSSHCPVVVKQQAHCDVPADLEPSSVDDRFNQRRGDENYVDGSRDARGEQQDDSHDWWKTMSEIATFGKADVHSSPRDEAATNIFKSSASSSLPSSSMICADATWPGCSADDFFDGMLCGSIKTVDDIYDTFMGVNHESKEEKSTFTKIVLKSSDDENDNISGDDDDHAEIGIQSSSTPVIFRNERFINASSMTIPASHQLHQEQRKSCRRLRMLPGGHNTRKASMKCQVYQLVDRKH